jgi:hypothetical protein
MKCIVGGPTETLFKPLTKAPLVFEGIGADQEEQALAQCPIETVRFGHHFTRFRPKNLNLDLQMWDGIRTLGRPHRP